MVHSKIILKIVFIIVALTGSITVNAQNPPFWNDIQTFKEKDIYTPPPSDAVLFIGSSSFTKWKDVQSYFPDYPIVNRGFGGSTLKDLIRYADDIIIPYHPKQVVIYCGDNDLAESDSIKSQIVFGRFKQLYNQIRAGLGNVSIVYVSIKPSVSRQRLMPEMVKTNALIEGFLKTEKNTAFVDIYHDMLDEYGNPKADLFLEDKLHMNEKGYLIWQKNIQPYLIR